MNLEEYNKVKDLSYLEYCDYLQNKYGKPIKPYMIKSPITGNWTKSYAQVISRTREGLVIHHKLENEELLLSSPVVQARLNDEKYQAPENLVYCDLLEHMLLHIDIKMETEDLEILRGPGLTQYITKDLTDFFCALAEDPNWQPALPWQVNCFNLIKDDRQVFIEMLKNYSILNNKVFNFKSIGSFESGLCFGGEAQRINECLERLND